MWPSTCAGTPDSSRCGAGPSRAGQFLRTRSWLPPMPPEVTTTACAVISKSLDLGARARLAAGDVAGLEHRAAHAGDRAAGDDQLGDPVPEAQLDQAGVDRGAHPAGERLDDAGPGAPDDVEAGHRVAVPGGGVAAALGPADHREEPDALLLEPGPLLPRRELQVGLGPLPGPVVLGAVEAGGAEPVLPGELQRVVHAQPALLRGVDEEQPAEGPPGLAAEGRLGLLVDQDHPLAGVGQLGGGDQAGQPAPTTTTSVSSCSPLSVLTGATLAGRPRPAPSPRGATRPAGAGPLADRRAAAPAPGRDHRGDQQRQRAPHRGRARRRAARRRADHGEQHLDQQRSDDRERHARGPATRRPRPGGSTGRGRGRGPPGAEGQQAGRAGRRPSPPSGVQQQPGQVDRPRRRQQQAREDGGHRAASGTLPGGAARRAWPLRCTGRANDGERRRPGREEDDGMPRA